MFHWLFFDVVPATRTNIDDYEHSHFFQRECSEEITGSEMAVSYCIEKVCPTYHYFHSHQCWWTRFSYI
jgi:hypothetical protein